MHRECKKDQSGPPSQTLVWIPNISFDDVKGSHLSTTILSSWTATVDIAYLVTFRFFFNDPSVLCTTAPSLYPSLSLFFCSPYSLSSFHTGFIVHNAITTHLNASPEGLIPSLSFFPSFKGTKCSKHFDLFWMVIHLFLKCKKNISDSVWEIVNVNLVPRRQIIHCWSMFSSPE